MSAYSNFKFFGKNMVKRYRDNNVSAKSLSEKYNVPYSSLIKYLRNNGVYRDNSELTLDESQIKKDHLAGISLRAIGKKHGCSHETIRKRLNRVGVLVPRRKSSARKFSKDIATEYTENKVSISCLAEKYKCSVAVISSILDEMNVTKRLNRYDDNIRRAAVILSKRFTINDTAKKLGMHPNTVLYILKDKEKYELQENINVVENKAMYK